MNKIQQRIFLYCGRLCALLAVVFFLYSHSSTPACAAFASSSCDPDYYDSLKDRAWLEAQREITQNQNLIFKADSVLQYTCFDKHLNQMAQSAKSLFSQSSRWGTSPPTNITTALNPVAQANDRYLTGNFNHSLLGGRSGTTYIHGTSVSAGSYSCSVMSGIWKEAKCMDFIHQSSHDAFFTFDDYATKADMRTLPTACTKTANFQNSIDRATGTAIPWASDPVVTYFYLFNRQGSDVCGNNSNPRRSRVKTGLLITRAVGSVTKYNEYVCLVPSCFYKPSGLNAGTCTQP